MATIIQQGSVLSVDNSLYNVQTAGNPWSLTQLATDTYRFEVRAGDTWEVDPATKNRSEIAMRSDIGGAKAIDVSYRMTVEAGAPNTAAFTILGQFHQSESDAAHGKAPPFTIGLVGEYMVVTIAYTDATGKDVVETIFTDKTAITRGAAYDFNVEATFDPNGSGHVVVTRNGVTIVNYDGALGWPGQSGVYWKEGIYRAAAPETLAVVYKGLSVDATPVTIAPPPKGPVSYNQYDGKGAIAATVTTQPDGAKAVQTFDSAGKLIKLVETTANADLTITNYGITGKTYVSETTVFDPAGKIVALSGRHADGSLDYQQIRHADGSIDNWQYDARGAATRHEVVKGDGARDVYEFAIAGNATETTHRSYDVQGVLRLLEQKFANGALDLKQVWNADGSTLVTDYNAAGTLVSTKLTYADGSADAREYGIVGQSYTSSASHYDAAGKVTSLVRYHADGSRDFASELSGGKTVNSFYDAKGALLKIESIAAGGARDVYDYGYAGKATESQHRSYDGQGVMRLLEQKYSDGTISLMQAWNKDGSVLLNKYSTVGALTQTTLTRADGSRDISDFGITGKTYATAISHYDAKGVVVALERLHADGSLDYSFVKDAAGTVVKTYNAAGLLTKIENTQSNGARDVYDYAVAGNATETLHRGYDSAGVMRVYEQKNPDGSLDYVKLLQADGSQMVTDYDTKGNFLTATRTSVAGKVDFTAVKVADGTLGKFFDTAGLLTKSELNRADGVRDIYDYGFASKAVASGHRVYDVNGKLVVYEAYFTTGKLDASQVWNADGSSLIKDFDAKGVLLSETLLRADGGRDVHQYAISNASYASYHAVYDKAGALDSIARYHADGTAEYRFEHAGSSTVATFFDARGVMTKVEKIGSDGARDVYDYGFAGKSVESSHRGYDSAGTLRLLKQKHADGTLDAVKSWNSDGSTVTAKYDAAGLLKTVTTVHAETPGLASRSLAAQGDASHPALDTGAAVTSTTDFYNAAGQVVKEENLLADGGRQIFDYHIANQAYVTTERQYAAGGTLSAMTMIDANGNKTAAGYAAGVTLHSGTGNDRFSLTDGDTIVFGDHFGKDKVFNFHAGTTGNDVIAIDHALVQDFAHLNLQQVGNDVVVTVADHGTITLDHVLLQNLHANDFLFF